MFFDTKKARKKTFKYRVTVKGVTISKHYTMSAANTKAKSIRASKVVKIGAKRTYSKTTSRRTKRRY